MTRMCRRICGIALLGVISLVSIFCVSAEEITPRYSYINHMTVSAYIDGDMVEYSGTAGPIYNEHRAKITVTLQRRSTDGGSWQNVKSNVVYGNYASQARYAGEYSADAGYEYRTYVRCTILDSDGVALETRSCYSNVVRP